MKEDSPILYTELGDICVILIKSNQKGIYYIFMDHMYDESEQDVQSTFFK